MIMSSQVNNPQQTPWFKSLLNFRTFAYQVKTFLQLFAVRIKKTNFSQYPINNYLASWSKFYQILHKRIQAYSNSKLQAIISTALYWIAPYLASSYFEIQSYIRQQKQGEELQLEALRQICRSSNIKQEWNLNLQTQDQMMHIPLYLLEYLVVKGLQLTSCLEERSIQMHSENGNLSNLTMLSLIDIECRKLQSSLSQLNTIVVHNEDQAPYKDLQVLKFNFVINQYELLKSSQKRIIFKYINRIKLILRWRAIQKKRKEICKQRKMKIFQLINGQQNYLNGLNEYIKNIKEPIQKLNILEINQLRLLFSSLIQIKTLHENIFELMKEEYVKYTDDQCYAPILQRIIPFFKVYTDYILNAESAQQFMKHLISSNKHIAQICRQYTANTNKLAENQLLQPTFRIARYEALFQEIIKKTSSSHKDYKLFIGVQQTFKLILRQVNNEVDRIVRNMKLNELDREFGSIDAPIFAENRQYLNQFNLVLIKEPYPLQVLFIIFNDLLLILDESNRKLQKRIEINEDFFARREQDNKIYRNMITIHSDGFMTFTTGVEDIYANKVNEIYLILKGITKQSGQLVYISVIGTEEIGSTSFAKYTEYVVEVKYLDIKKLLHLRFSLINQMIYDMQAYYRDPLKIAQEQNLRKSWFNSHKSKTIQARKLIICQIFQKLFNHQLIKKNPIYFLKYLNLPENFYDIARTSFEKRISISQTVTLSGLKRSYLTKKQQKEAFTVLCGTQIKLGRDLFHDLENDQEMKKIKENASRIQIRVITLEQQQPIFLRITDYDTVEDVCNRISTLKGLRSNRDFRLFHQIGKKQLRVLDHEQLITKIFHFPRIEANNPNFYEKVKKSISKIVFSESYPILIFKKYYYLPYPIEQAQMRKDLVRLRLMVFQVFAQIKQMKYQLNFDENLIFLSMLIYILIEGEIGRFKQIDPQIVHRVIPQAIFRLKNYTQLQWLQKCDRHLKRLHQQITKVIEYNKQQYIEGKIKAETVSKHNLYFGHKHLCSQIVLNKIRTNPIFGSNIFYVQPHSNCYKKLKERGLNVSFNMWLAVSVQAIKLLSPSSKQSVFQLKYEDISKPIVFCQAILFITSGPLEEEFRFNTYQSLQISQLVKYNQALNDILVNLRNDGELNTRVKQYRQQLIQYGSTFSDGEQA